MPLIFDLALFTAKPGRSRALDRYARAARLPPGSDEALMLEAMRQARFSIWRVERRHEAAGLIVFDILRETEARLVDENFEAHAQEGIAIGGRLSQPEDFAMTCGAFAPVTPDKVAEDPRFAIALYRAAIASGMMEQVAFA
ncbi:MAG TPA: hypothetical protein VJ770_09025 [Stellaceae bacterium]|nr:hypothetical protein [Stellaceae bacterium]